MNDGQAVRIAVAFARQASTTPSAGLCAACVEVLHVSGAGLSVMSGTNTGPVCSSNDRSSQLEDLQFVLGEGPSRDAFTSGLPVDEPDLEHASTDRWPTFSQPALDIGTRAVFAFPIDAGTERFGVLTLYQDTSGPLTEEQSADSLVVADVLAQTMLTIQSNDQSDVLADALVDAHDHRAQVHQASGMVGVQLGTPVVDALARIRAHAYATGRSIASIADDIVGRRLLLDRGTDEAGV